MIPNVIITKTWTQGILKGYATLVGHFSKFYVYINQKCMDLVMIPLFSDFLILSLLSLITIFDNFLILPLLSLMLKKHIYVDTKI